MWGRPMALDNNHAKIAHSSDYSVQKDFLKEYNNHIGAMQVVAMCAKVYCCENWEKVKDWSKLNVVIGCRQGQVEFFNYTGPRKRRQVVGKPERKDVLNDMFDRIDKEDEKRHNPVETVTEVVMDEEWDFSMTINGKEYWWLDDESVIIIANYIEKNVQGEADSPREGQPEAV